ncbi:hypothetical protein M902_2507 [Bacteriovorax sp. BAL6_X]|uniref:hypothetical protein n=1 Tax=Bacteriovorax sp. BAL6_X TaxID=1201290 RepID=UPI0003865EB5|nr:hypothetical protein [Bacteriovorax sp. BAL6_X]EPZ51065.1 hypothetical protein M902_2507 [Bacteriovorax sp. BAL6_X]
MKLIPISLIVLLLTTPAFAHKDKQKNMSKKSEAQEMMKKDKKTKMKQHRERVPASKEGKKGVSLTDTHFLIYE